MRNLIVLFTAAFAFAACPAGAPAQEYQPKSIQFLGVPEYSDQEAGHLA
jgi:hypothetical protein